MTPRILRSKIAQAAAVAGCAAALMFTSNASGADLRYGVALVESDGICLAATGSLVETGTAALLYPPDGTTPVTAVVGEPVGGCERMARAAVSGPFYRLTTDTPVAETMNPFVVVLGTSSRMPQVRACTASQAMHLTVWAGKPLSSKRLWRQYWYLGYDVEPTCKSADTAP
jgi:hypothetical protein